MLRSSLQLRSLACLLTLAFALGGAPAQGDTAQPNESGDLPRPFEPLPGPFEPMPGPFGERFDPREHRPQFPANRTRYIGGQLLNAQIIDRDINTRREEARRILQGRFGKFLNPYLSMEARLGFAAGIHEGDAKIDRMGGLYLNAYWPFNDRLAVYVLGGGTYAEGHTRSQIDDSRQHWSETGLSYGAGLNLFTRGGLGVYAEYVWYFDNELSLGDVEMEGFGIGAQIAF